MCLGFWVLEMPQSFAPPQVESSKDVESEASPSWFGVASAPDEMILTVIGGGFTLLKWGVWFAVRVHVCSLISGFVQPVSLYFMFHPHKVCRLSFYWLLGTCAACAGI
mmetsp:Transcript_74360/g.125183  ORF Transcript_74360/g.125183 Transcript_74360/m.125183 type:complete len:108 (-) Transcript_74360:138-461(-)